MFKRTSCSLLLLFFAVGTINCLLRCQENSCDIVKCRNATPEECNKPNQDLRKGGWCNCCTVCYTTLNENDQCSSLVTIGGPPPTAACKEGLKCIEGRCVKSPSN